MTMNNLTAMLTRTLAAKTDAALERLADLDAEVALAFAVAEEAATRKIIAAVAGLEAGLADRASRFEDRLAHLATEALDAALATLGECIDRLGYHEEGKPVAEETRIPTREEIEAAEYDARYVPTPEAIAEEEVFGDDPSLEADMNELKEEDESARRGELVAAQVVEAERPATAAPDDDEDGEDTEDTDDDEESAQALPFVYDAEGLHECRGAGRQKRYSPVDIPEPGGLYWVRGKGKRWVQVIFAG
jgi:hypothetical protein